MKTSFSFVILLSWVTIAFWPNVLNNTNYNSIWNTINKQYPTIHKGTATLNLDYWQELYKSIHTLNFPTKNEILLRPITTVIAPPTPNSTVAMKIQSRLQLKCEDISSVGLLVQKNILLKCHKIKVGMVNLIYTYTDPHTTAIPIKYVI